MSKTEESQKIKMRQRAKRVEASLLGGFLICFVSFFIYVGIVNAPHAMILIAGLIISIGVIAGILYLTGGYRFFK